MKNKYILLINLFTLISCKNQVSDLSKSNKDSTNTTTVSPINDCQSSDKTKPVFTSSITILEAGTSKSSPKISWNKATDNCELSHYEIKIGTTLGSDNILSSTNIGNLLEYKQSNLNLNYQTDYYISLVAVDKKGNKSSMIHSSSWTIFNPKTLTDMVLWLDANDLNSLIDQAGLKPNQSGFSGKIANWKDISNSNAIHNFSASGSNQPNYDFNSNAVTFNGVNQFMYTADHADINTSTSTQKTLSIALKSGTSTLGRQVIYEQGGGTRGLNIYIENNQIHCGFWNRRDDGDEFQDFDKVSTNISTNSNYVITLIYDYSNYNGRSGVNGNITCYLNKSNEGSFETTSRLYPHSGDIGLGNMNDGSYFPDGAKSGDNYHFQGTIYEFIAYNKVHSKDNIEKLVEYFSSKWSFN